MYIVQFKEWSNNWSTMQDPEYFESFQDAVARCSQFQGLFNVEYIGNNSYVANGLEVWVENSTTSEVLHRN